MSRHKDHWYDKELKMIFTFFCCQEKILFKKILSSSSEIKKRKNVFFYLTSKVSHNHVWVEKYPEV